MNTFTLILCDGTHTERIERVASFVGEDPSGSFGVLAGHERLMTWLTLGLARFRTVDGAWQYLAIPGGILYFVDNELSISTRRYVIDTDYQRISATLEEQLLAEERNLRALKDTLRRMEQGLLQRMRALAREGSAEAVMP